MAAAVTTESSYQRITPLAGREDYAIWRLRIGFEAMNRGFDEHLEAGAAPPSPILATSENASAVSRREIEISSWNKTARRAAGFVCSHIADNVLGKLRSIMLSKTGFTARQVLEALDKEYEQTNTAISSFYTLERLFNTKYVDGTSIQTHVDTIRDILAQLEIYGAPLPEQTGAFALLLSFPKTAEWELFRAPILAAVTEEKPLTFGHVEARLQSHALGAEAEAAANAAAHATANAVASKKVSSRVGKFCNLHGAGRHNTDECRDLKKALEHVRTTKAAGDSSTPSGSGNRPGAKAHRAAKDSDTDYASDDPGQASAHVVLSPQTIANLERR